MKLSVCHYSYHRTVVKNKWNCRNFVEAVKTLGADGVDFHVKYLGDPDTAAARVKKALAGSSLELSGLSMSNDFSLIDDEGYFKQIEMVKTWLKVAEQLGAPVSRIFGGHILPENLVDPAVRHKITERISRALVEVTKEAEKLGVILALENHVGIPCSGEEQMDIIKKIDSKNLQATIDVGNYMHCCQEGHDGTRAAAESCAYVHFKDFIKTRSETSSKEWDIKPCTIGKGDVDHKKCLEILRDSGYNGFVALEYEGPDDELGGVPESFKYSAGLMREMRLRS